MTFVNQTKHLVVIVDNILNLLIEKLMVHLQQLNMGHVLNNEDLSECWHLLHILHYASYDSNSDEALYKILDYYG